MFSRAARLRFRRKIRMRQRQVTTLGEQTEEQLDQHLFHRLERLVPVRRFVISWTALVVLLIIAVGIQALSLNGLYQQFRPIAGGTYEEGVVGEFTNANPMFASSAADSTVSKLLFSGLLTYGADNRLVGDLAEEWKSDERGQIYIVRLRENLRWHDGRKLTADDVVFTYKTIQNGDAQSPLRSSWQGVGVKALDDRTVEFTLQNPLASFPYALTNGIAPKHILEDIPLADLRSVPFNTSEPVGSGPFRWNALEVTGADLGKREVKVALTRFDEYHLGKPKLEGFTVHVYRTPGQMVTGFNDRKVRGMSGLPTPPADLSDQAVVYDFTQTAAMMVFFRTTQGVLQDKAVRQAAVRAVDISDIRQELGYPVPAVDAPLLRGQIGYDESLAQLKYDPKAANTQLQGAGWVMSEAGKVREKDGQLLEFTLHAESDSETARVTRVLQQQWLEVGIKVNVELQDNKEFQVTLSQHGYEALLRGVAIGLDPDVFPFWHSSQAEGGLNFSEYQSSAADTALEAARTRTDPQLRAEKYKPFLEAWRDDAPALGLYQPRSIYITRNKVDGLTVHDVNSATDRLANVYEWSIRRAKTTVD